LILRKICKFDASRCEILRLKRTQFDFRWGHTPDPLGEEAYSAPTDPIAVFQGPTSKGRAGKDGEGKREGRGRGREKKARRREEEGEVRGRKGRGGAMPPPIF